MMMTFKFFALFFLALLTCFSFIGLVGETTTGTDTGSVSASSLTAFPCEFTFFYTPSSILAAAEAADDDAMPSRTRMIMLQHLPNMMVESYYFTAFSLESFTTSTAVASNATSSEHAREVAVSRPSPPRPPPPRPRPPPPKLQGHFQVPCVPLTLNDSLLFHMNLTSAVSLLENVRSIHTVMLVLEILLIVLIKTFHAYSQYIDSSHNKKNSKKNSKKNRIVVLGTSAVVVPDPVAPSAAAAASTTKKHNIQPTHAAGPISSCIRIRAAARAALIRRRRRALGRRKRNKRVSPQEETNNNNNKSLLKQQQQQALIIWQEPSLLLKAFLRVIAELAPSQEQHQVLHDDGEVKETLVVDAASFPQQPHVETTPLRTVAAVSSSSTDSCKKHAKPRTLGPISACIRIRAADRATLTRRRALRKVNNNGSSQEETNNNYNNNINNKEYKLIIWQPALPEIFRVAELAPSQEQHQLLQDDGEVKDTLVVDAAFPQHPLVKTTPLRTVGAVSSSSTDSCKKHAKPTLGPITACIRIRAAARATLTRRRALRKLNHGSSPEETNNNNNINNKEYELIIWQPSLLQELLAAEHARQAVELARQAEELARQAAAQQRAEGIRRRIKSAIGIQAQMRGYFERTRFERQRKHTMACVIQSAWRVSRLPYVPQAERLVRGLYRTPEEECTFRIYFAWYRMRLSLSTFYVDGSREMRISLASREVEQQYMHEKRAYNRIQFEARRARIEASVLKRLEEDNNKCEQLVWQSLFLCIGAVTFIEFFVRAIFNALSMKGGGIFEVAHELGFIKHLPSSDILEALWYALWSHPCSLTKNQIIEEIWAVAFWLALAAIYVILLLRWYHRKFVAAAKQDIFIEPRFKRGWYDAAGSTITRGSVIWMICLFLKYLASSGFFIFPVSLSVGSRNNL